MLNDTICAVSTALKEGAISIVRLSGEEAFRIIKEISDLKEIVPNTIRYTHIYDQEEMLDEVLVSCFKAPHSYTAEDLVEINCHGGIYVTRTILNLLIKKGCRPAEPGEFSKRAYLNGRLDLSQAESANDLIKAANSLQARSALRGLNGSLEKLLDPLLLEMKNIIAMIEVNIDYPEYEDEIEMTAEQIAPAVTKWIVWEENMIRKAERFRTVKDGLDTVIIGKPNVGKSSLLNALLGEDKAIVTDFAGTTRDLVEGKAILDNVILNLTDTAGIRESNDIVEAIGIQKSKEALAKADLVLLVMDGANIDEEDQRLLKLSEGSKRLIVYNKKDLCPHDGINISAKENDISMLVDYLNEHYADAIALADEDILNNERQIALMKRSLTALKELNAALSTLPLDVIFEDLMESYHRLCEILGKEYQEDLIDHMFRNFCLGK